MSNERSIEPETPEMRSVLIRAAAAPSAVSRSPVLSFSKPSPLPAGSSPTCEQITWKPTDPLPSLPELYHLENAHAKISSDSGGEIASRIAEFLTQQSIAATFKENRAVAETACHTKLHVTLFEDDDQVIVEVQRRSGCGFVFSKCSKAILRAAKGMPNRGLMPKKFAIPASVLAQNVQEEEDSSAAAERLILPTQKYDLQMLGMVGLARRAQSPDFSIDTTTLAEVLKHIAKECIDLPEPYASYMRRDALTTLAGGLAHKRISTETISSKILQQLLQDLLHDCPHVAYQSARCLTCLATTTGGEDFKVKITELGGLPSISGGAKTLALETETRKLQMGMR